MKKYTTVEVGGIITQIATKTNIEGYTEGLLEVFIPDNLVEKKETEKWIKENNIRMSKICKLLNDNNL